MGFLRPTGVTYCDPDLAHHTSVLFTGADGVTRLIDLNGDVVEQWPFAGVPPRILDPALTGGRRGQIGVQLSGSGDARGGIYANGTIGLLDWDGNKSWEWGREAPGGHAFQNHDWQVLPNGNWLVLVTVPRAVEGLGPNVVGDQGLIEVDPIDKSIVWRWSSGDHLDELGLSERGMGLLREAVARDPGNSWGCLEMNSATRLGENRWFDNDGAGLLVEEFHPDNIMVSFRKANVVAIVERASGRIVWRLGPYFDSEKSGDQHDRILRHNLPRPLDQISGQHNPHMIPKGLPGAGNVLVFDCQGGAGYPAAPLGIYAGSRILEVDPVTKHIVWQWTAGEEGLPPWAFFSSFVSNAQRLPDGNTLVTEGMQGRLFQVTAAGKVAWEYYSPYTGYGVGGEPEVPVPRVPGVDRLSLTHLVYRSYAVPDHYLPEPVEKSVAAVKVRAVGG
ncbi:hypothetical protein RBB50_012799 [Rhinocladiella similis]